MSSNYFIIFVFLLRSSSAQGYTYAGQDRIQQKQAEVSEVVGIMKDNVARVLERDQRLSDLDNRAS